MTESAPSASEAIPDLATSTGQTLTELSQNQLLLVVFLRHAECTFCRQALSDLHKIEDQLAEERARLVVVSMSSEEDMLETLKQYKLTDAIAMSDPEKLLYQHFQFSSGGMPELMSPKVMWLGMKACIFEGHGVGKREGDIRQMPGVIVMKNGEVLNRYEHKTAADRPNYLKLVQEARTT